MKSKWIVLLSIFLLGCSGSPTRTAYQAEKNRMDMINLKKNMTMACVKYEMGYPKKVEKKTFDGKEYEIWYFLTKGVNLDQSRYIDENFTPFVFYKGNLKGWGWHFYNHLFDINNARFKAKRTAEEKYVEKEHHWPNYNHKIITPYMKEDKATDQSLEKSIETLLNSNVEESAATPKTNSVQSIPKDALEKDGAKSPQNSDGGGSLEIIEYQTKNNGLKDGKSATVIENNAADQASQTKEAIKAIPKSKTPPKAKVETPKVPKAPKSKAATPTPKITTPATKTSNKQNSNTHSQSIQSK